MRRGMHPAHLQCLRIVAVSNILSSSVEARASFRQPLGEYRLALNLVAQVLVFGHLVGMQSRGQHKAIVPFKGWRSHFRELLAGPLKDLTLHVDRAGDVLRE